jgi:hypothetical protein
MIIPWIVVWLLEGQPVLHMWNVWAVTLVIALILL